MAISLAAHYSPFCARKLLDGQRVRKSELRVGKLKGIDWYHEQNKERKKERRKERKKERKKEKRKKERKKDW